MGAAHWGLRLHLEELFCGGSGVLEIAVAAISTLKDHKGESAPEDGAAGRTARQGPPYACCGCLVRIGNIPPKDRLIIKHSRVSQVHPGSSMGSRALLT
jgi:hypothetical protein